MFDALVLDRAWCQQEPLVSRIRRLLSEVAEDCKGEEATFWVMSENGEEIHGAVNHGECSQAMEELTVPVSDSVVGMVAATGQGACVGPDDKMNPLAYEKTGKKVTAMVAVPVYVNGLLIGALTAINPQGGGLFGSDELGEMEWKAWLLGLILDERLRSDS